MLGTDHAQIFGLVICFIQGMAVVPVYHSIEQHAWQAADTESAAEHRHALDSIATVDSKIRSTT